MIISREKSDRVYNALRLSKYSPEQFHMGMNVELEHRDITRGNLLLTAKIVIAHLKEVPDYYTQLKTIEQ
jgi:Protein of unknown function (DUF5661)